MKIRLTESKLNQLIKESINQILITEAFKSNMLRKFFQEHGGVDTYYGQFSLGDISDEQIGYAREFDERNDAFSEMRRLKMPDQRRMRSDYDMKYHFEIYTAKDGTAILVGIDRNTIETKPHWGGDYEKKIADRLWRNGWNFKTRDNRYVDDSDTYYYQSPANDFGVHNSDDFRNKMTQNKRDYQNQPNDTKEEYKKNKIQDLRNYLQKYYPDTLKKLQKNR